MMKGHAVSDSLKGRQTQPFTAKDVCVCVVMLIISHISNVFISMTSTSFMILLMVVFLNVIINARYLLIETDDEKEG